tara:strand:- start:1763 stop:2404 length:642 start_codon:yes stop_codon:yes gene_type:complete
LPTILLKKYNMKNIFKITFVVLLLISCKNTNKSKAMEGVMDEITGNNDDINQKYDLLLKNLGTKTPLTDDQLIAAFPKKLGKLNASENRNDSPRTTSDKSVIGKFGDDTVRMEILDGAGPSAFLAILPLKMLHLNKIKSENNNTIRYSKKEHNGILIFGTDRDEDTKADYQSEIRFLYDNRFYVTLEGKRMDVNALWNAIDINDLKKFKDYNN